MKKPTNYSLYTLMIILLSFVACGPSGSKKRNSAANSNDEGVTTSSLRSTDFANYSLKRNVELLEDLSNGDEFIQNLNKYTLAVSVDNPKSRFYELTCISNFAEKYSVKIDSQSMSASLELTVHDWVRSSMEYVCKLTDEWKQLVEEQRYQLPKDYLIQGKMLAEQFMRQVDYQKKMGAIVFAKNSKFITNGGIVNIKATDLIAFEGSQIVTFEEGSLSAAENENGKAGGSITVVTERSLGKLDVFMRGQNGGTPVVHQFSLSDFQIDSNAVCPRFDSKIEATLGTSAYKIVSEGNKHFIPVGRMIHKIGNKKDSKGHDGGNSGMFVHNTVKNGLNLQISHEPGKGSKGSVSKVYEVAVEYFKGRDDLISKKWNRSRKRRRSLRKLIKSAIGVYGTEMYNKKCNSFVRKSLVGTFKDTSLDGNDGSIGL